MRIGIYLLLLLGGSIQLLLAKGASGQDLNKTALRLELNNESLLNAFKKIEQATPFTFAYNKKEISPVRGLSLTGAERSLRVTLDLLLQNTGLRYEQVGNNIIVTLPPSPRNPGAADRHGTEDSVINVHGIITNGDGKPVIGASVLVKGSSKGTSTDDKGFFELKGISPGAVLQISSVGFEDQEVGVGSRSTVNIQMKDKSASGKLDEVVVVGYGTARKKDLTGPVSHIGSRELGDRPVANIDQALAAQMPGVQVQAVTGTPGTPLQIRIRGASSVSASNDPLYIVDGVPVDNLADIDPGTIESIDVLKDASTAAIYGARGSNGVVLVTTRKGTRGKPRITASVNIGRQTPEQLVKMMNPQEWIQFRKDLIDSAWVAKDRVNNKASDPMDVRAARLTSSSAPVTNTHSGANTTYMYDPYWAYGTDSLDYVDWQKAFYRPAYQQRYNLGVTGGNDNSLYALSGEYTNQDGMVPNSGYKRYSFRSNIELKLSDATKIGIEAAPSFATQTGTPSDGKDGTGATVAGTAPIQEKGSGSNSGTVGTTPYRWVADQVSPIFYSKSVLYQTQTTKLLSNAYIDSRIAKGLNLRATAGWNALSSDFKSYVPTSVSSSRRTAAPGSQSTANRNTTRNQYFLFQAVATYSISIKEHQLNAVAGYSVEQTNNATTAQRNTGFPNDNLYTFDQGSSTVSISNSFESKRRQLSYFGRVNYSYEGKYLLTGSFRRDGISRFFGNNKWGFFPAASAAWRISQEPFMAGLSHTISDLKLRYSWGIVGNDRISGGDYPYAGLIGVSSYDFNGLPYTGYAISTIANPDLRWE
ncbi:MAG: SusC/RagA family TonB-linked outer membrane protein, partial [Bacteroidetes bacterium]|nr:SusC/RagA family TonB-linked outer membrane protein [Bacteroidota bacterium]